MEIRDAIRTMVGKQTERIIVAEVIAVDEEALTVDCTPLDDTADLLGINISIDEEDDGMVCYIPKVGGLVVVVLTSENTGFVIQSSVGKIRLNGGKNGGLVNIGKLVNNLNSLKDYVEALKDAVSAGLNAVGVGTAASGPTGKAAFDTAMESQSISLADMEDKNITH